MNINNIVESFCGVIAGYLLATFIAWDIIDITSPFCLRGLFLLFIFTLYRSCTSKREL